MIFNDWRLYRLILFNIIQNAVKYNNRNGQILVTMTIKQIDGQNIFNTIVKDTGIGIERARANLLFRMCGELMHFGQMKLVKDNSIGLGLTNSKIFTEAQNGEIKFLKSDPGDT